jgi:hypothetical protein
MTPQVTIDFKANVSDAISGVKQVNSEFKNLAGGANQVVEGVTGLSLGSLSAAGAVVAVGNEIKKAAQETLEYSDTVRDMSQVSGAGAEETSRLIQAMDDMGVETQDLDSLVRGAAQKGIVLTTDSLSKMADEFNGLRSTEEKNDYALDHFGKTGLEVEKVLSQGGQKIRDYSAAVKDDMIMTQEQLKQARELEVALDDLSDTWKGLEYTLGKTVIPAGVEIVGIFNEIYEEMEDNRGGLLRLIPGFSLYNAVVNHAKDRMLELSKATDDASNSASHWGPTTGHLAMATDDFSASAGNAAQKTEDWAAQGEYAAGALALTSTNVEILNQKAEANKTAMDNMATAQANLTDAENTWKEGTAGDVKQALDDAKLPADQYAQALQAIDDAYGTKYVERKHMADDITTLTDQFKQNKNVDDYKLKLGLLSDSFMPFDTNILTAKGHLDDVNAQLEALNGKHVDAFVDVHITEVGGSGGGGTHGSGPQNPSNPGFRAAGGHVEAGQPYIVGERGPEPFIPDESGTILPHSEMNALGSTVVNIHSGAVQINAPQNMDPKALAQMVNNELGKLVRSATKSGRGYAGHG